MSGISPDPASHRGGPPVTIRAGTPADAEAICTLHRRSIRAVGREFYTEAEVESWAHGLVPERYAQGMVEKGETFLLAIGGSGEPSGAVIGFCSFRDDEILGFYVDPSHARSGIGRAMLDHAERALTASGRHVARVRASRSGRPFYEKQGYRVIDEHIFRSRGGLDIVTFNMRKSLHRENTDKL